MSPPGTGAADDPAQTAGFRINRFRTLDSTNAEALRRGAVPGEAYLAVSQTAGRGRIGRSWHSPPGNLHATLVASMPAGRNPAHLAFVAGVAVRDALAEMAPEARFTLKWPNDVLCGGRKLAGILIEAGERGYAVGVGINLVAVPPDTAVNVPATHLKAVSGRNIPPEAILGAVCRALSAWHGTWESQGFGPLRTAWLASAHRIGDTIAASTGTGNRIEGRFAGLDDDGALLVEDAVGRRHTIAAGDVMPTGAQ